MLSCGSGKARRGYIEVETSRSDSKLGGRSVPSMAMELSGHGTRSCVAGREGSFGYGG